MEQVLRIVKSIGNSLNFFLTKDVYSLRHKALIDRIDKVEEDESEMKREMNWLKVGILVSVVIGLVVLGIVIFHI